MSLIRTRLRAAVRVMQYYNSVPLIGAVQTTSLLVVMILIDTIAFLYQYLYSFTFLTKVSIPLDTKTPAVFANSSNGIF